MMMMLNGIFYLALMFYLGSGAAVNTEPKITEGKTGDVINLLDENIELQVDPRKYPNRYVADFALENAKQAVDYYLPTMHCNWAITIGNCSFKFPYIKKKVFVILHFVYSKIFYIIKYDVFIVTYGKFTHVGARVLDLHILLINLKMRLELLYLSSKRLLMCFKADYHTQDYKYDSTVGCTLGCFRFGKKDE